MKDLFVNLRTDERDQTIISPLAVDKERRSRRDLARPLGSHSSSRA